MPTSPDCDVYDLLSVRFGEDFGGADATPSVLSPDEESALRRMADHRSVRRFSDRRIAPDLLRILFGCAFSAPAKSDLQQACVVHVQDSARRAALHAMLPTMSWVADAPGFLVFCGENRRIRRICELRDKPFGNDHLDSFFNASVDAALVMMSFIQAAEIVGLGCCPLSHIRNHAQAVCDLLELPRYVFPVAGLVVGYPARTPLFSPRLPLASTVHVDRYDDGDLSEVLDRYDAHRNREQGTIPAEKQRGRDVFGTSETYGWSEDKARQVAVTEREDFGAFIRRQGFNLE